MNFREYIQQGFVFLDGATGSNLQEHGMQAGECPELWILNHPDVFVELQKQYILSGSDVLYAPTFTCNRIKLAEYGLEDKLHEMTKQLVALSRQAVEESGTTRKIYIYDDDRRTVESDGNTYAGRIDRRVQRTGKCVDRCRRGSVCRRDDDEPAGMPWSSSCDQRNLWRYDSNPCNIDIPG